MKESIFILDFKRDKVDMGYIIQENYIFEKRRILRGLVEVSEYLKISSEKQKFPGRDFYLWMRYLANVGKIRLNYFKLRIMLLNRNI